MLQQGLSLVLALMLLEWARHLQLGFLKKPKSYSHGSGCDNTMYKESLGNIGPYSADQKSSVVIRLIKTESAILAFHIQMD